MIEKLIFCGRVILLLVMVAGCTTLSTNNDEAMELHSKIQVVDSSNIESVVIKKMNCYTSTFAPVSPEDFESRNTISVDSIIDSLKVNSIVFSLSKLFREAEQQSKGTESTILPYFEFEILFETKRKGTENIGILELHVIPNVRSEYSEQKIQANGRSCRAIIHLI